MNQIKSWLKKTYPHLLDFIFPKYCLGCQAEGSYLCANCQPSLCASKSLHCFVCGRRSPTGHACPNCRQKNNSRLAGILVASDWNNLLLRQIIYEYKYRFIEELADPLAQIIIAHLELHQFIKQKNNQLVFLPVPLHKRRLAWRGFNQAELLAGAVGQEFKIPAINDVLIRCRYSPPQMGITDKIKRQDNIQNSFALSPAISPDQKKILKNKTIVLVDDICTTASTLEECAKALKPLGPKEIWGLVIARG